MGIDISVGNPESEYYISEKLGSATSLLSWKCDVAKKEGIDFWKGYNGKFKLALIHQGDYKLEDQP